MKFHRIYALSIRHLYLIKSSFPRILDLIYWPTIQILLWGFISQFFTMYSDYYNNTIGVILSCAILYDFLFRSSISFNMLFLEEIWSRNFTNLFVAPLKISEIITALTSTALLRTLIGIIPAIILEILGPIFIILGYQTKITAAFLSLFCLATAIIFHNDFSNQMQLTSFLKNIALAGGFLILFVNGAKGFSLDNKFKK